MSKKNIDKITVEELSNIYTTGDMWDSFNQNNACNKLMYFENGVRYTLRFLGPFYKVNRIYVNKMSYFQDLISSEEIKSVILGNKTVYEKVYDRFNEKEKEIISECEKKSKLSNQSSCSAMHSTDNTPTYSCYSVDNTPTYSRLSMPLPRSTVEGADNIFNTINSVNSVQRLKTTFFHDEQEKIKEAKMILNRLYQPSKWQPCLLINALVSNNRHKSIEVIALSKIMMREMKYNNSFFIPNIPVSGLNAHDLIIKRSGEMLDSKYEVKISDSVTSLKKTDMSFILNRGLKNIEAIIKDMNKHSVEKRSSYFYRKLSKSQLPEITELSLFQELNKKLGKLDSDMAAIDVDNKLDSLPDEAFEHNGDMNNPIGCLEI